jgi:EPS-associated MarR family transcriptional regulator
MNNKPNILDKEEAYFLLKEIENNPRISQRHLSGKLAISLGKINFLINALIDKGIIKAKNFKNSQKKLAYAYYLTPQGIKAKLELAYKFLVRKTEEYEKLKLEIEHLKKEANGTEAKGAAA